MAKQVQVAWTATENTGDYSPDSGTVTFAANSTSETITITATDDALSEGEEGFTVTLGDITIPLPAAQVSLGTAKSATATIAESDPITVNISGPEEEVTEGGAGTYTVSLSPSGVTPTSDLTVNYATADGTAVAGSDYTAIPETTLTFTSADHAAKTFTVQTTEDILAENSETFTVSISSPLGGGGPTPAIGTGKATVTTTIRDNDALILSPSNPPSSTDIKLTVDPDSVNENAGRHASR